MSSFEETIIEVWRQALVENVRAINLGAESYPVRRTAKRGLRQVDFIFDGHEIRGFEQNPETKSRWAQLARSGKKVMQFLRSVTDCRMSVVVPLNEYYPAWSRSAEPEKHLGTIYTV